MKLLYIMCIDILQILRIIFTTTLFTTNNFHKLLIYDVTF